jgi:hypothetical protein
MSPLESIGGISRLLPQVETPTRSNMIAPISQAIAPGCPPILFRAFSLKSAGINSPQGCRAVDFSDEKTIEMRLPTPPEITDSYFNSRIATHYTGSRVGSPVISTTSSLIWALHKAFLATQDKISPQEPTQVSISVIEVQGLDPRSRVFSGKELYARLKGIDGAVPKENYYYKSAREYPIWAAINAEAIFKTVTLSDLQMAASTCFSTQKLLRLELIAPSTNLNQVFLKFKSKPVDLDMTTCIGLVNLMILFDVLPNCPPSIIACFAETVIDGFHVDIPGENFIDHTFEYWMFQSNSIHATQSPEGLDIERARAAFRQGVLSGMKQWKNKRRYNRVSKYNRDRLINKSTA